MVYLVLCLENSGCFVAVKVANRVAYLCTIYLIGAVTQHVCFAVDDAFSIGNARNLVLIIGKIKIGTVREIADMVVPRQC